MDVPEAAGPEWAFIQETMYQSTDESEDEVLTDEEGSPALDPDTEGEGPISCNSQRPGKQRHKVVTQKSFMSWPPTYRACEVSVPFLMWTRVLRCSGDLDRSTMC